MMAVLNPATVECLSPAVKAPPHLNANERPKKGEILEKEGVCVNIKSAEEVKNKEAKHVRMSDSGSETISECPTAEPKFGSR
jgi:hypothetical protein